LFIIYPYSTDTGGAVKQSEFVRWLAQQGATFKNGSKHLKVYLNGQQTHLPRHPSAELKTGLVEGIKKQLGLK
jgi:mRNA interferase HicA